MTMRESHFLTVDILGNLHRRIGFLEGAYLVDVSNAPGDTSGTYTTKPVAGDFILIPRALDLDETVDVSSIDGKFLYTLKCSAKANS